MFCPNCGTRIDQGGRFCPNCGTFVPSDETPGGQPGTLPGGMEPFGPGMAAGAAGNGGNGGKKGPRAGLVIGIIAALILVCAGLTVFLFLRNREEKTDAASGSSAGNESQVSLSGTESGAAGSQSGNTPGGFPGIGNGNAQAAPEGTPGGEPGSAAGTPGNETGGMTNEQAGQILSGAAQNTDDTSAGGVVSGAPVITDADIVLSQGAKAEEIRKLNTGMVSQTIDVYADNYTPVRNASLYWDNTLFYTLEDVYPNKSTDGQINSYLITKKSFVNAATGNRMEYEIYTKPSNGAVNKIVSIEYFQDHLEITDYYYLDNGKVSFVFVRDDINYVPSYAVPTKDGQRFYFNSDCMVKWRIVSGGTITNYCIGSPSTNENRNGSEILYDRLDAVSKKAYDDAEKNILNAAYNTYSTVLGAENVGWITGFVYNKDGAPRTDAHVYLWKDNEYLYQCSPSQDGSYFIAVPGSPDTYRLVIVTPGCDTVIVYDITIIAGVLYTYVDTVYVIEQNAAPCQQVLQVRDALNYAANGVDMMAVPDAQVNIRCGLNAKTTEIVAAGTTDSLGNLSVRLLPGMYTVEVIKSGYDVIYVNIVILIDLGTVEIHFSPSLPAGEMRIVLSWGAWPEDLDSHLFTPYDSSLGDEGYHIFYSNQTDAAGDNLDVDDTTSYGPETITIPVVKDGLYKYYVVDYSNCSHGSPTSFDMSNSGAVVNVYTSSGLVATFHVPTGQSGVIWEVFEIRNGQIVPNQRYYNNIDTTDWWYH